MKLIVFRHGEAEERKHGQSDEERRLTDKSKRDVEVVTKGFRSRMVLYELLLPNHLFSFPRIPLGVASGLEVLRGTPLKKLS